ncbi:hypothetical protein H1V43_26465 [Streptomyces sp. PSKA54]|uniref:TetR/AcrR family transcriptional regulator n=1 Tax=Streptomyces himalayensis subsp. aureolus TaxID=2758039 RepID=A0A7W2D4X3_9ACTN|nr:hypothetical protein [Streptomyces himalayensis]MBA4864828.1 hypothetical protein [Streptomyces himalayensis subsp. aureolus]
MPDHAPPGMTQVHRAVVDTMAMYGPRRVPLAHVARLAGTNRQFLYRNWPRTSNLVRQACEGELRRVLHAAAEVGDPFPPLCLAVEQVVRAARLIREHPVTEAAARTAPDLLLKSLTGPATPLHTQALHWLYERLDVLRFHKDLESTGRLILTVAAPFALLPPTPKSRDERTRLDTRLRSALHACLSPAPPCTACAPPRQLPSGSPEPGS